MALAQYSMNWASSLCGTATNFFHSTSHPHKPPYITVIEDIQIWDGEKTLDETSITIEGQIISSVGETAKPKNAKIIQGNGGFLMPGLIDAHFHLVSGNILIPFQVLAESHLKTMVESGITTALDMGSYPAKKMPQFHNQSKRGLTSLLWSGPAACAPEGFPAALPSFPKDAIVTSNESAVNYAETRIREGSDYIKIFVNDTGGPEQEYQEIIKNIADDNKKMVVSHAASFKAHEIARDVGGKFITHVPKDQALTKTGVQQMLDQNQIAIPTLIMSQSFINTTHKENTSYSYSNDSVALMYELGVPILVGTDASKPLGFVGYGTSLHEELSLLHDAGMSADDILRGATSLTAKYFQLADRGRIAPGMRADLLLLRKSPLDDITNSATIDRVWTAGHLAYPKIRR